MDEAITNELRAGYETAYIDSNYPSNLAYKPQFVFNNVDVGKKVLTTLENELLRCDYFRMSVAFVTMGGITPLLQTLKTLEQRNVQGEILTTNYLNFSEPRALEKLHELKNITLKMYDVDRAKTGFHTKGYIFQEKEIYRIIIGSSNLTSAALTGSREWNTEIVSTEQGELTQEIVKEYSELWNSIYSFEFDSFFEKYKEKYKIIKKQRQLAVSQKVTSIENYRLEPNSMQVGFIANLRKLLESKQNRALLISATGTGKTYASAFAMRELGFHRVLFLVHRGQLAKQTKASYERVFGKSVSMGLVGTGIHEYEKDYVFATIQTLNRDSHLMQYQPDAFDCIVLDEAHHVSAATYQKIFHYFKPKLWLGMTATPDKRDDDLEGKNIYEIFNYQIAYEIRLQQAMKENLLCPFHYFGITDLEVVGDEGKNVKKLDVNQFRQLVSDRRVAHIIEQARFYGYSGDRVKGLVFCSRVEESRELSRKFNEHGYRTIALNGDTSQEERMAAFERLAMDERDATAEMQPLDYIFSVEILNEGVDIVEVNQVIMLRQTESPIVFIQQLGRGLRKAAGKEYVVILDFIGNYTNNFMIPIALSGDRSYNADALRKYVISGNNTIPGASTVHFEEVAKERIFSSINKIRGIRTIIKESYVSLKARLGRVPYLIDFYKSGEVDPLVIIKEYKTYAAFIEKADSNANVEKLDESEKKILEYLSKTILSGIRPYELEILQAFMSENILDEQNFCRYLSEKYGYQFSMSDMEHAVSVLQGHFVSKDSEYQQYKHIDIVERNSQGFIRRLAAYANRLCHDEFRRQMNDLVQVGLQRYRDNYVSSDKFILYEKYSRRDVSLLMDCEKDLSSTMYGMKRIGDDVFIFVTYHKEENDDETKEYLAGKPDYADVFEDNMTFLWDSQIGKGVDSTYMRDVIQAERKHLFVKKSDAETSFYYMGQFDIVWVHPAKKMDNRGKQRDITKMKVHMHHAVREDLLRYLESHIKMDQKEENGDENS